MFRKQPTFGCDKAVLKWQGRQPHLLLKQRKKRTTGYL